MAFTVPTCVTPKVMLTKWGKTKTKDGRLVPEGKKEEMAGNSSDTLDGCNKIDFYAFSFLKV